MSDLVFLGLRADRAASKLAPKPLPKLVGRSAHAVRLPKPSIDVGELAADLVSLFRGEAFDLHLQDRISCDRTQPECSLYGFSQFAGVALGCGTDRNEFCESIQDLEVRREDLATTQRISSVVIHVATIPTGVRFLPAEHPVVDGAEAGPLLRRRERGARRARYRSAGRRASRRRLLVDKMDVKRCATRHPFALRTWWCAVAIRRLRLAGLAVVHQTRLHAFR